MEVQHPHSPRHPFPLKIPIYRLVSSEISIALGRRCIPITLINQRVKGLDVRRREGALVSMSLSRCYAEQAVSSQNPWPISCEIDLCQKQSVSPHTVRRTHRPDSRCLFSAENKINCWRMKSIISR
ncbi:hypothetical protein QQF64_008685 [Cirrhinus molitorella]|uniref:Uncharacterized protein n=1 Tax=Cirrhinus molitorella TaxID=172907 RepID=A0ABR3M6U6_9TELE